MLVSADVELAVVLSQKLGRALRGAERHFDKS